MTLAIRTADISAAATTDLGEAAMCADLSARAVATYADVAEALPRLWPSMPDEQRVRYYLWAARHVAEAREMLQAAWALLDHVAFWMGTFAGDIEDIERSGRVPDVDDEDLAPREHGPVTRVLRETVIVAPCPAQPAVAAASSPAMALPAPRAPRGHRACVVCGTAFVKVPNKKYCSAACRDEAYARRHGS